MLTLVSRHSGHFFTEILSLFDTDDPLSIQGDVVGRSAMSEPGSPENINWILDMFETCRHMHRRCSQLLTHPGPQAKRTTGSTETHFAMPTRLIDVQTLKLWETGRQKGPYAALSYSWGKDRSKRFKTRDESYDERLNGFREDDLPQTILDAVILTRKLGLKHLWVDAICIIQGNKEDWATESAIMNEVYANSTITIAAAATKEAVEGFLKKRDIATKPAVSLQSKCSNGIDSGTMHISQRVGSVYEDLERSPLCSRGWTLQERVLSRRTIHFAQDQLYWECQERSVSEDGLDFRDSFSINGFFSSTGDLTRTEKFSDIVGTWQMLIADYSNRMLSAASDKLPAFSGLAKEAQNRAGMSSDDYCAGLWKTDLPRALLWEALPGGCQPQKWRAPSWSWASIDGLISYSLNSPNRDYNYIEEMEILDVITKPKYAVYPLGEITSDCSMKVRAHLFHANRASEKIRFDPGYRIRTRELGGEDWIEAVFYADYIGGPLEFPCLLVRCGVDIGANNTITYWYFLGLEEVQRSDIKIYRRHGVGYLAKIGKWLSTSHPLEEIVLV